MKFEINEAELNIIRQWFDSVQDLNEAFLNQADYELAFKIYSMLGIRAPKSISNKTPSLTVSKENKEPSW